MEKNPFAMIGDEWMLVTAEKEGAVNTMTASWGGVGIMGERQLLPSICVPSVTPGSLWMQVSTLRCLSLEENRRRLWAIWAVCQDVKSRIRLRSRSSYSAD